MKFCIFLSKIIFHPFLFFVVVPLWILSKDILRNMNLYFLFDFKPPYCSHRLETWGLVSVVKDLRSCYRGHRLEVLLPQSQTWGLATVVTDLRSCYRGHRLEALQLWSQTWGRTTLVTDLRICYRGHRLEACLVNMSYHGLRQREALAVHPSSSQRLYLSTHLPQLWSLPYTRCVVSL